MRELLVKGMLLGMVRGKGAVLRTSKLHAGGRVIAATSLQQNGYCV